MGFVSPTLCVSYKPQSIPHDFGYGQVDNNVGACLHYINSPNISLYRWILLLSKSCHSREVWLAFYLRINATMVGYIPIALCVLTLSWLLRTAHSLQRNIAIAKSSTLPYAISREFSSILATIEPHCSLNSSYRRHRRLFLDRNSRSYPGTAQGNSLLSRPAMAHVSNSTPHLLHSS
jgi:hypothetical protein